MSAAYIPQQVIQRARTIAWATALGAITVEALSEREGLSCAEAEERLDEAVGLGLLQKHSVLVGYSDLYTATIAEPEVWPASTRMPAATPIRRGCARRESPSRMPGIRLPA